MKSERAELLYFDGAKSAPLSSITSWDRFLGTDNQSGFTITVDNAFRRVPWLFRGIHYRAAAVASMPYALTRGKRDVTESPEYKRLTGKLKQLLYKTEMSLTTKAAAYWIKNVNAVGRNVTPDWLAADTMTYENDSQGITKFLRTLDINNPQEYEPDRIVYFWLPDHDTELGPGTAPATVALRACGLLDNLDTFAEKYFARGAIKATLLSIPGNTPQKEQDRLETWWNRLLSGVSSAWKSIVLKSTVVPTIIGEGLEDTATDKLTTQKREDIANALGVPQSLLFSNAANFATAAQDDLHFYMKTIMPECDLIEETLNTQLFAPEGLTFAFLPQKLETFQQYELQKAQAIQVLAGEPVLTVDEAREMLGRGPKPKTEAPPPPVIMQVAEPPAPSEDAEPAPSSGESESAKRAELYSWRRKVIKAVRKGKSAGEVPFESEAIPSEAADSIRSWLRMPHDNSEDYIIATFKLYGGIE
jgi:HK97 family phage portal protein